MGRDFLHFDQGFIRKSFYAVPSCADYKRAFVNPEIYEFSEEKKTYNEGCLSFPGIHADVARSLSIRMRYMDTDFVEHDEEFTGLKAWVIQHEYDHIEAIHDSFVKSAFSFRGFMV